MNSLIAKDYFYNFAQCRVLCHLFLKNNHCENTRFSWVVEKNEIVLMCCQISIFLFSPHPVKWEEEGKLPFPSKDYILGCQPFPTLFPACISSYELTFLSFALFFNHQCFFFRITIKKIPWFYIHSSPYGQVLSLFLSSFFFLSFNNHHFLWIFLFKHFMQLKHTIYSQIPNLQPQNFRPERILKIAQFNLFISSERGTRMVTPKSRKSVIGHFQL